MTNTMAGNQALTGRILALAAIAALTACGQSGGGLGGMVQPGQIVGGGTKQISGVQPVGGFLPNPSLLNPAARGRRRSSTVARPRISRHTIRSSSSRWRSGRRQILN
jgi:hypothetical protein